MRPNEPHDTSPESSFRPITAVLWDFHGTLAQVEPLSRSVEIAADQLGVELPPYRATILADALGALGWVGSGQPAKVTPSFAAAWADRDLTESAHREAFIGLADQTSGAFDGFAEAMYERLIAPDGWVAFRDTIPTLRALRDAKIPTALISNIGFDLRPVIKHLGFDDLIDHWILSYEVGWCKPEPEIFREACLRLEVEPEDVLMVGDQPADAAATALGIRAYLVPHAGPGGDVGLDAVRQLVGAQRVE
ncbi:MAG TPA: HAD-IA family hydrolase [Stackebrandtia sp.]|uniref:HAD family hydrolase n=1 Tax=Stackebrandtia sp. TaxID=2023065 RepID=UPI002D6EE2C6|nr:HAD-IA family hydrolase [Stackebrandtia sp.]HZE38210.1 HAD-IA family hydrolase [Stackebrandtia sp.]